MILGAHVKREYTSQEGGSREKLLAATTAVADLFDHNGLLLQAAQYFTMGPRNSEPHPTGSLPRHLIWLVHNRYVDPYNVKAFRDQMRMCDDAGADAFVVHEPSDPIHLDSLVTARITQRNKTALFMETGPFTDGRYATPSHLNRLIMRYGAPGFGIVLDTAHLWMSSADIRHYRDAKRWLTNLDKTIPYIIHLNDSQNAMGTGPDEHACLMKGRIWSRLSYKDSGLRAFIEFAVAHSCPVILERDSLEEIQQDLTVLRAI